MVSINYRRVANRFLAKRFRSRTAGLREADPKSKQEFLDTFYGGGGKAKVKNPSRDSQIRERNKEVSFDYAYDTNEEFRREVDEKFERWRESSKNDSTLGSPGGWPEGIIDLAQRGVEVSRRPLSDKGKKEGRNQSALVTLELDGRTADFVFKPAKGEEGFIRPGIPGGTYHAREQSAYAIDALLGGQRGVVPPTFSRGSNSGSYQAFSHGTSDMYGDEMNRLASAVKPEDLTKCADFNRLQVLDLILGHEDRHGGNLLFHFEGEASPENLRLTAIDNGLSLSSPLPKPEDHRYDRRAFHRFYYSPPKNKTLSPQDVIKYTADGIRAKTLGDKAISDALSNIPPDLLDQIKSIDLTEMARQLISSGIHEKGAVRAALVRVAALQEDPQIFSKFLRDFSGNLEEAWTNFQVMSGKGDLLLEKAGGGQRSEEIDMALDKYQPESWASPPDIKDFNEHHLKLQMAHHQMWAGGGGGKASPLPKTNRTGPQKTQKIEPNTTRKTKPSPDSQKTLPEGSQQKSFPPPDRQQTEKLASIWLHQELKP